MRPTGFAAAALAVLLGGSANAQPPVDGTPALVASSKSATATLPGPTDAVAARPGAETAAASTSVTYQIGDATLTSTLVTNGPVADTPENRARYGQPDSRAGKRTAAKGN